MGKSASVEQLQRADDEVIKMIQTGMKLSQIPRVKDRLSKFKQSVYQMSLDGSNSPSAGKNYQTMQPAEDRYK